MHDSCARIHRQGQKNDVTSHGLKWEGKERCRVRLTRYADLLDAFIAVVVDENVDRNRFAVIVFLKTKHANNQVYLSYRLSRLLQHTAAKTKGSNVEILCRLCSYLHRVFTVLSKPYE